MIPSKWKVPIQKVVVKRSGEADPLGAIPKDGKKLSVRLLGNALVEKIETESDPSQGRDQSFKEEIMVYWGAEDTRPSLISPQDRFYVLYEVWEPVGGLVEYPLGVKLRLRKAGVQWELPA
jgi:hypothetical protein